MSIYVNIYFWSFSPPKINKTLRDFKEEKKGYQQKNTNQIDILLISNPDFGGIMEKKMSFLVLYKNDFEIRSL